MRFRFWYFIVCLSLAATALISQPGQAEANSPNKIYLPLAMSSGSNAAPAFPNEADFVSSVTNQKADQVTGVYVQNVLAKPVVQQPEGNFSYISTDSKVVTQYALATMQGVTGLLAHNGLAGKNFFDLQMGQQVSVVYGNGFVKHYTVRQILRYQAVEPFNYASDFIDLATGERLDVAELFSRVYLGGDHVTFQTCISQNGSASWGRLFVIAE